MSRRSGPTHSLIVPVAELLRRPGSHRTLSVRADFDGLATSSAAVVGPVDLRIRLESMVGGLEATGVLLAGWRGSCRRCLEPVEQMVHQDLREVFSPAPHDEDTYPINDGEVDLAPMVRDSLVLALPIAPLCSEDCAGPAPDAYPMNRIDPAPEERPGDSRWAVLDALRAGQ
ncbi:YceD family protein [Candidatus Poriferisocius sp.]|uniref:YceD family protein n=1 Tax=Candidatus Poriferisocius sp. TaxID=3101276 RepID=UPI003B020C13